MQTNDTRRHRLPGLDAVLSDRCRLLSQRNLPLLPAKRSAHGAGAAAATVRVDHVAVAWHLIVHIRQELPHAFPLFFSNFHSVTTQTGRDVSAAFFLFFK